MNDQKVFQIESAMWKSQVGLCSSLWISEASFSRKELQFHNFGNVCTFSSVQTNFIKKDGRGWGFRFRLQVQTVTNMLVIVSSCSLIGQEITCLKCCRKIKIDKRKNILRAESNSNSGDPIKACKCKNHFRIIQVALK